MPVSHVGPLQKGYMQVLSKYFYILVHILKEVYYTQRKYREKSKASAHSPAINPSSFCHGRYFLYKDRACFNCFLNPTYIHLLIQNLLWTYPPQRLQGILTTFRVLFTTSKPVVLWYRRTHPCSQKIPSNVSSLSSPELKNLGSMDVPNSSSSAQVSDFSFQNLHLMK